MQSKYKTKANKQNTNQETSTQKMDSFSL